MKPIDSAWVVLKNEGALETPSSTGGAFLDTKRRAMGQAGPFMYDIGGGGEGRPSTTSLLHRLATGQAPVGQGTRRALAGRAAGVGLGAANALLAAERAQRGGDIESALGAAYAGYQVPKQGVTGALEGEWGQKPMLDAHGRPLLDEEGKPRLQEEATPGGAIGGQMEAKDLFDRYRNKPMDAELLPEPQQQTPSWENTVHPNPMGLGLDWDKALPPEDPRRMMPTDNVGESYQLPQYGDIEYADQVPLSPAQQNLVNQGISPTTPTLGGQGGDEAGTTGDVGAWWNPDKPNEFQMSEPMDLAFRMLKGAMR